jgi:Zn-dependent metalloprotease
VRRINALGAAAAVVLATTAPAAAVTAPPAGPASGASNSAALAGRAAAQAAAAQAAAALVASRPPGLHAGAGDAFWQQPVISAAGLQYVPYRRTYRGLPVHGGDFVVVADQAGHVLSLSVAQRTAITVRTAPARPAAAAVAAARAAAGSTVDAVAAPRLTVYALGSPRLAWETVLTGHVGARPSSRHVFTDASTGAVLDQYDDVADGLGRGGIYRNVPVATHRRPDGTFSMTDPTRAGLSCRNYYSGAVLAGRDDVWGNYDGTRVETGCVDALYSVQRTWDMLATWLGRSGIDGSGRGYPLHVGLNDVNAFWAGSYVAVGRNTAGRFVGSLDVVGHEFGHAVDATTPGGRSGNGVSEATGDILGTAVEFFANDRHDPPDFTIGEAVSLLGPGPYRVMYDPTLVGDPACYSDAIPVMEPHQAAGPLDHWFVLLADGSAAAGGQPASPTCDGSTVTGLGVQTAAVIFYHAMLSKTTGMTYLRYRTATLAAAKNLFPGSCTAFDTVRAAWDAISVPAQELDPTCEPGASGG